MSESKFKECLAVFLCGATVMIVELTGSRLFAPYIGTSVFVWTSLIGVILAFLSIGYYLGGKYSDKNPSTSVLSSIAFYAGLTTAVVAITNGPVLYYLSHAELDIRLKAVVSTGLLFGVPSVLLGMILPYCVRVALSKIEDSGSVIGNFYAISTAGSIFGTFLGGFFLVSFLGTVSIYILCGAILVFASILFNRETGAKLKWSTFLFLLAWSVLFSQTRSAGALGSTLDIDTKYHRVLVRDVKESNTIVRMLVTDPLGAQSMMNVSDPDGLFSEYTRALGKIVEEVYPKNDILVLGGGAYTLPKFIDKNYRASKTTVVEIDEELTKIAKKHFSFAPSRNIRIEHLDARIFLQGSEKNAFDLVIFDVFSSSPSIPFHLVTIESFNSIANTLRNDGIIALNVISSLKGPESLFLKKLYKTMSSVFTDARVYKVESSESFEEIQNIIIIASDSGESIDRAARILIESSEEIKMQPNLSEHDVYIDNYAPVEWDLLPLFNAKSN